LCNSKTDALLPETTEKRLPQRVDLLRKLEDFLEQDQAED
jgi:hypothetical protein